jgi:hypothetical protein
MLLNKEQLNDRFNSEIAKAVEDALQYSPPSHRASDREKITRMIKSAFGMDIADISSDSSSIPKESGKLS